MSENSKEEWTVLISAVISLTLSVRDRRAPADPRTPLIVRDRREPAVPFLMV